MIENFCHKLPVEISRPMYYEYYNRLKEIDFIIDNRTAYKKLQEDRKVVELILSLSIFYKRVVANIKGASSFATAVFKDSKASAIRIGNYDLTHQEKNKLLAIVINYRKLLEKYEISHDIITTAENRDFIRKIKDLKNRLEEIERNNNESNPNESI